MHGIVNLLLSVLITQGVGTLHKQLSPLRELLQDLVASYRPYVKVRYHEMRTNLHARPEQLDLQGLGTVSLTIPQLPNNFPQPQPKASKENFRYQAAAHRPHVPSRNTMRKRLRSSEFKAPMWSAGRKQSPCRTPSSSSERTIRTAPSP